METFDFREAVEVYAVEQLILKTNGEDLGTLEEKMLAYENEHLLLLEEYALLISL